ncbi:MAG TPA: cyclopropane-fatty-acyl-phospholipid synthase family protein [Casimicrobiaceae bacterium]|nr:cyclopropane-fatty-acyl-phospholipid synthase family protein [Casimicrobiaceae bacterium]
MRSIVEYSLARAGASAPVPFEVTFPDGGRFRNRDGDPGFALRFRNSRAQRRIAMFGHIGLLDAYFDGDLDIDGDLRKLFRTAMDGGGFGPPNALVWVRNQWHELTRSNRTREQAKANANFHYALGEDFYKLWLDDPFMMYTCAYWKEGTATLEQAQMNKIDHVCRKIRLEDGESVIDIGTGFGGFMFRALQNYDLRITGLNTTTEQVRYVSEEIERRKLGDRLRSVEGDFRDVFGQFDKVVSIGVLEHAGRDQLDDVLRAHAEFLKPGGLGMLHFIGHVGRRDTEYFIRQHVFPGGWIPSLAEVIVSMENHGLEVVDIENLRRHYALTLDEWAARFDANWQRIHAIDPKRFDERFRRIWRVYLLGCAEMFRSPRERTHLFQIVYSKGNITRENYPMSRAHLYEPVPMAAEPSAGAHTRDGSRVASSVDRADA